MEAGASPPTSMCNANKRALRPCRITISPAQVAATVHRVFAKYYCGIYILYYLAQVEGTVHRVFVSKRPGVDDFMRQVPQLLLYGPKKLYKCSCCGGPRCQLTPWLILKAMGSMPGPQCSS